MNIPDLPAEHTVPTRSELGFARYPQLLTTYGSTVRVYESSAAEHPHLWVSIVEPDDLNEWAVAHARKAVYEGGYHDAHAHMSVEAAAALVAQLQAAIANHYQTREG